MKKILFMVIIGLLSGIVSSCNPTTSSNEYDSAWAPHTNTTWTMTYPYSTSTMVEEFVKTDGGFKFKGFVADTGSYDYSFTPGGMYIVSNIATASSATLSFTVKITSIPDTVVLASGKQLHTFGSLSGSVQTKGIDSVFTAPVAYTAESVTMPLKISPDSCSRQFKLNMKISWKAFTAGTPLSALPKNKKLNIEFSNVVMRAYGVDILK